MIGCHIVHEWKGKSNVAMESYNQRTFLLHEIGDLHLDFYFSLESEIY